MADPVRDFAGTEDGEWAVVNGDFAVVAGAEAVPQGIRVRVGTILGECFLDESVGVDYLGQINVKNPDPLVVRSLLAAAIADTPDVTQVVGADLLQTGRDATVNYAVGTVYNEELITDFISVPT